MIQYYFHILMKDNLHLLASMYKAKIFSNLNNNNKSENTQYSIRYIIRN